MDRPAESLWHVYLLRCADSSLYTGITTDLRWRCLQHNNGTASRYTRGHRPVAAYPAAEIPAA
jgi:putative endonuclease